jgi:hypothetical protein
MTSRHRIAGAAGTAAMVAVFMVVSCDRAPGEVAVEPIDSSHAYDAWQPAPGECPVSIHNSYSTVGPDGRIYPTWHPPIDPLTGCEFGHDHGRDPSGSALYGETGPIPFGYAAEMHGIPDSHVPRQEDHVGHRIDWQNGVRVAVSGGAAGDVAHVTCDVLTKLQAPRSGAAGADLTELVYAIRCSDGAAMHATLLTPAGSRLDVLAYDDDPHSTFNGVRRLVMGDHALTERSPAVWYTDPLGRQAQTEPFPGSIRQYIAHAGASSRVAGTAVSDRAPVRSTLSLAP